MYGEKLFEKTIFFDLKDATIQNFGEETGSEIFDTACRICYDLIKKADAPDRRLKKSVCRVTAPVAAYYKALTASGLSKKHAYEYVANLVYKRAEENKRKYEYMAQHKNAYMEFCSDIRRRIKKEYYKAGWETEWKTLDERQLCFEFRTCYYKDIFTKFHCPELCTLICQTDIIEFSGLIPVIAFERTKTLANGDDCCKFIFKKIK